MRSKKIRFDKSLRLHSVPRLCSSQLRYPQQPRLVRWLRLLLCTPNPVLRRNLHSTPIPIQRRSCWCWPFQRLRCGQSGLKLQLLYSCWRPVRQYRWSAASGWMNPDQAGQNPKRCSRRCWTPMRSHPHWCLSPGSHCCLYPGTGWSLQCQYLRSSPHQQPAWRYWTFEAVQLWLFAP